MDYFWHQHLKSSIVLGIDWGRDYWPANSNYVKRKSLILIWLQNVSLMKNRCRCQIKWPFCCFSIILLLCFILHLFHLFLFCCINSPGSTADFVHFLSSGRANNRIRFTFTGIHLDLLSLVVVEMMYCDSSLILHLVPM